MLGALRDKSGKPNGAIRALALLVALMLALPLTVFAVRLVRDLVGMLL